MTHQSLHTVAYTIVPNNFFFFFISPYITKTRLCNFDSLKPHFYIVKLGFRGVNIIFLISAQKHRLWVLVRTASTSTHNLCFEQKYEKYQSFFIWNFQFLEMKFSIYLNRRVFIMKNMLHGYSLPTFHSKTCCGYSLEVTQWDASNEYPQHMFSWKNKKNIYFLVEKYYLIQSYTFVFIEKIPVFLHIKKKQHLIRSYEVFINKILNF